MNDKAVCRTAPATPGLLTTLMNAGQTVLSRETASQFRETVDTSEYQSNRTQGSSPAYLASPVPRTVAQIHGDSNRPIADLEPGQVGLHAAQAVAPGQKPPVQPAAELHEAVSAAFLPPDPMKLFSQLQQQFLMQQEQQATERRFQQERQ